MIINQINNMNYWSLVNMLMGQITPEIRKHILEKLTEMNNDLLYTPNVMPVIQPDVTRPLLNTRKKDMDEKSVPIEPLNYNIGSPPNNYKNREIDLDDIIDDLQKEPDTLDMKLAKIKFLRDKIVSDKRRRKSQSLKNN